MLKKIILAIMVVVCIGSISTWALAHKKTAPVASASYSVYKSDGTITTLTPSPQHPLIFFATWCPHCQKDLANKSNPNAYYIDTFTKESNTQESFNSIQNFIEGYHSDPNTKQYFVSVDKHPQGIPYVPYTVEKYGTASTN